MSVIRNSSYMALGTAVSRVTGVLRDIAMTAALGFYVVSDAYSLGNTLPNIIYILLIGGALNAVFIPQLVRHMQDDLDAGKAFADRLLTATGVFLLLLSVISVLAAPLIVQLYSPAEMSPAQLELAIAFARLCLPQIFFYGAYTMLAQVLNARGKFAAAMFAPIVNNLVAIGVFLAFIFLAQPNAANLTSLSTGQIWWLGAGTTFGVVLQAAVLLPALWRSGYVFQLRFDWKESGLDKAAKLAGWTVALVLVNQLAYVVITRIATAANLAAQVANETPVGLTSYQKAHLVFVLPHSLIAVSLVTALLPMMSRLAHAGEFAQLGMEVSKHARILLVVMTPIAALLFLTGEDIAQLLFGYGAAGLAAARATGEVIAMLALGLPAYSMVYVLYRAWYAQENTRTPFLVAVVLNISNLAIAIPLTAQLPNSERVAGLGVAYSIAYTGTAVFAWIWLNRSGISLDTKSLLASFWRILLASGLGMLLALWIPEFSGNSVVVLMLNLAKSWLLGVGSFLILAKFLKVAEVDALLTVVSRKFRRS